MPPVRSTVHRVAGSHAVPIGYDRDLFVVAFDHRAPHLSTIFGVEGEPTPEQTARIIDAKRVIFEGFRGAIDQGVPTDRAGVLVDEQFGAESAREAAGRRLDRGHARGAVGSRLVRARVRRRLRRPHRGIRRRPSPRSSCGSTPKGTPPTTNARCARSGSLSDWLAPRETRFMLELIVPGTAGADRGRRERGGVRKHRATPADARPRSRSSRRPASRPTSGRSKASTAARTARWSPSRRAPAAVTAWGAWCSAVARTTPRVDGWLRAASGVAGYLGFAIGRSVWQIAISRYLDGSLDRDAAAERIATAYLRCIDVFAG